MYVQAGGFLLSLMPYSAVYSGKGIKPLILRQSEWLESHI
jgi:hypothetical protein